MKTGDPHDSHTKMAKILYVLVLKTRAICLPPHATNVIKYNVGDHKLKTFE